MHSEPFNNRPSGWLVAYNLAQFIGLPVVFPVLTGLSLLKKKYRAQLPSRMGLGAGRLLPAKRDKHIWIHTMSLGEFNAARPFIQEISNAFPQAKLILSATTATGLSALKQSPFAENAVITTLPFDFLPLVNHVLGVLRPDCFILIETDVWPNFLWSLRRQNIPAILVNGSISSTAARRIKKVPGAARFLYGPFSCMGMQSEDDAARLLALGIAPDRIRNCGNLKFDYRPARISEDEKTRLLRLAGFTGNSRIITAGSTHAGEEIKIAQAFSRLRQSLPSSALVLAPRDVNRGAEVAEILQSYGLACRFRSGSAVSSQVQAGAHQVFILDTLGELERFYGISDIAFVGGSLAPVGGHNILEPAAFGLPVIFGPFME
ncbi:MAG: hypothetical protein DSZ23_04840, partial [Thermodesulfatator sp.]